MFPVARLSWRHQQLHGCRHHFRIRNVVCPLCLRLFVESAFAVGSGGTPDLGGFSNTIGSLADVAGSGGAITNTSAGAAAATLTTGGDNTSTSFASTINDGNGVLGLIKVGTGTMVLASENGYSGGTTISGGRRIAPPRASRRRVPSSAFAPTNSMRCRTAS
jgi:autotransporter-associated beta strand protein